MNCHQAQKHLPAFLDNELNSSRRERLATHLYDCAACGREAAQAREFDEYLRALYGTGRLRVSPNFLPRVVAQMQAESQGVALSAAAWPGWLGGWTWARQLLETRLLRLPTFAATVAVVLLALLCGHQVGRRMTPILSGAIFHHSARSGAPSRELLQLVPRELVAQASTHKPNPTRDEETSQIAQQMAGAGR